MTQRRLAAPLVGMLIGTTITALAQAITTTATVSLPGLNVVENRRAGERMLIEGMVRRMFPETVDANGDPALIDLVAFSGSARGPLSGMAQRAVFVQLDNQSRIGVVGTTERSGVSTIHFLAQGNPQESSCMHKIHCYMMNERKRRSDRPRNRASKLAEIAVQAAGNGE